MGLAHGHRTAARRRVARTGAALALVGAGFLAATLLGCGPAGHYSRTPGGGGSPGDAAAPDSPISGTGGTVVGSGGSGGQGSGGVAGGNSGGTVGSGGGGSSGTPGASGGAGTGGSVGGTGGSGGGVGGVGGGAGRAATGGAAGGTGGAATGGSGTGGRGTGGAGTGGAGTGGAGTGGMGTGGAATGGAAPVIISIDFVGGPSTASPVAPPMAATEGAGLKLATNWNSAAGSTGTLSALKLSNGSASTATAMWSSPPVAPDTGIWRNPYTDTPGDTRMMTGYLDPTAVASPAKVTVMGLPTTMTATGYDVYVYGTGDIPNMAMRTYSYTIGTTTLSMTQTGPSPTAFPGYMLSTAGGAGNVVVFRNLNTASFVLTATPGAAIRCPVNGIQIVSPTGR